MKQLVRNVDLRQCSAWLKQFNDQLATYNLARQWLVMFFNYCIGNNYITRAPLDRTTLKPKKRIKPIRNAPSEDQFTAIISTIREQQFTDHADDTSELNLPEFSPRSLRLLFIITAIERGVPIKTVADWQGHSDGGVLILSTYSDVINRRTNQDAAQLLA